MSVPEGFKCPKCGGSEWETITDTASMCRGWVDQANGTFAQCGFKWKQEDEDRKD